MIVPVTGVELGRIARAIRRRLGLRQADVAGRARVHRSVVSKIERGRADELTFRTLRTVFDALGAKLDVKPLWRGPQLDRLLDEAHARLAAAWKARLEAWGWLVRAEVSFSRYGERGRIDLFCWYPPLHLMVVIEIKTDLVEAHDLLGLLDVKKRLAPLIGADLGWTAAVAVIPMVLFKDSTTVRRRVERLAPLFGEFELRGRQAVSWLRSPSLASTPRGMLIYSDLPYVTGGRVKQVGPERVRVSRAPTSLADRLPSQQATRGV